MFSLFRKTKPQPVIDQTYYNERFATDKHWTEHYTKSGYYFLWTVILDRLRKLRPNAVLEIGCGPGQLASAMAESGVVTRYTGIDFSGVAIEQARRVCPGNFVFRQEDALTSKIYEEAEYDTVVTTEFLEHVEGDLDVLRRLPAGTRMLGTVPNFPYVSHVRHFKDSGEVDARYRSLFTEDFDIADIRGVQPNTRFFLIEGVRSAP